MFFAFALAVPVFGALTAADLQAVERIVTASESRMKAYVDTKIEASEKAMMARIDAVESNQVERDKRVTSGIQELRATMRWWIGVTIGVLMAIIGFLYYVQRTIGRLLERTDIIIEEWMRRSDKLAAQEAEIAALRAENERLKASPLVSASGGRLDTDGGTGG